MQGSYTSKGHSTDFLKMHSLILLAIISYGLNLFIKIKKLVNKIIVSKKKNLKMIRYFKENN